VQSALFLCSNYISVGACGALFGLLTCTLSEIIMNCTTYSNEVSRSCIICLLFFKFLVSSLCFHEYCTGTCGMFLCCSQLCFDLQYIDTILYVLRVLHTSLLYPWNTCPQDP